MRQEPYGVFHEADKVTSYSKPAIKGIHHTVNARSKGFPYKDFD